jgi:hypothetical protein
VMHALARHHHRHRPDLLGHGASDKPRPTMRWRPTPTACATCSTCSASSPPRWWATRWAGEWPPSSPTSSRSAASGWCWWPAGERAATCRPLLRLASAPLADVFLAPFHGR